MSTPVLISGDSLLVLTGAGISAESGVPTYRGPGGIYDSDPDLAPVLSAAGFRERPEEVWEHIDRMRALVAGTGPNEAHRILAEWEREGRFGRFLLVTQNVDGLHQDAGSERVSEIHGSIWRFAAPREEEPDLAGFFDGGDREELLRRWSFENEMVVWEDREVPFRHIPPSHDPAVRPDAVFFDEDYGNRLLWVEHFLRAGCDAILVVGCSGGVEVLHTLIRYARAQNPAVRIVNVNPHQDCIEGEHEFIRAGASEGLAALQEEIARRRPRS